MRSSCLNTREIEEILRQKGINATAQRLALARYILCEANHPTAEHLKYWADVNFPKCSQATVYNTLHVLESAGLVKSFHNLVQGKVVYDSNVTPHHHFVDESGQILDLEPHCLSINLPPEWQVSQCELVLRGKKY